MDVAGSRSDLLGDTCQERDDVVIGFLFDLADAVDGEAGFAFDGAQVFLRDLARFAGQDLDLEPDVELVLQRPDPAHHFAAVTMYHDQGKLADGRVPCQRREIVLLDPGGFLLVLRGRTRYQSG